MDLLFEPGNRAGLLYAARSDFIVVDGRLVGLSRSLSYPVLGLKGIDAVLYDVEVDEMTVVCCIVAGVLLF